LEELRCALGVEDARPADTAVKALLDRLVQALDLDGDGRLTEAEFVELALRLQQLSQGHQRLLTHLLPVDADTDDRLDHLELARLLRSVDARPLTSDEERTLFGAKRRPLSSADCVDRLLLS
jgi:Ca2+-binding EF-hand superfamily protein